MSYKKYHFTLLLNNHDTPLNLIQLYQAHYWYIPRRSSFFPAFDKIYKTLSDLDCTKEFKQHKLQNCSILFKQWENNSSSKRIQNIYFEASENCLNISKGTNKCYFTLLLRDDNIIEQLIDLYNIHSKHIQQHHILVTAYHRIYNTISNLYYGCNNESTQRKLKNFHVLLKQWEKDATSKIIKDIYNEAAQNFQKTNITVNWTPKWAFEQYNYNSIHDDWQTICFKQHLPIKIEEQLWIQEYFLTPNVLDKAKIRSVAELRNVNTSRWPIAEELQERYRTATPYQGYCLRVEAKKFNINTDEWKRDSGY